MNRSLRDLLLAELRQGGMPSVLTLRLAVSRSIAGVLHELHLLRAEGLVGRGEGRWFMAHDAASQKAVT
jgi:hypothetical protein